MAWWSGRGKPASASRLARRDRLGFSGYYLRASWTSPGLATSRPASTADLYLNPRGAAFGWLLYAAACHAPQVLGMIVS